MPGAGTSIVFNVKQYGAKGDGVAIDTPAINRAIDAASVSGGGTVHFPSGTYASYSIHLKSNVALYLDQGATILAASVSERSTASGASYDPPEPKTAWDSYQDFGHNHWHNSFDLGGGATEHSNPWPRPDLGQGFGSRW